MQLQVFAWWFIWWICNSHIRGDNLLERTKLIYLNGKFAPPLLPGAEERFWQELERMTTTVEWTEGKNGRNSRTQRWLHAVGRKQWEQCCKYADAETVKSWIKRKRAHIHACEVAEGQINEWILTWAAKGRREKKKAFHKGGRGQLMKTWEKRKKTEWLCAYRAQMSRGNCVGGLLCRHLPACSTILFFPAVLTLRFSWRAQHNPDRYITKGTAGVSLYFRFRWLVMMAYSWSFL